MFYISTSAAPGKALFATLERLSDNFLWNVTASAWQSAPSAANARVTLTEGTGNRVGSYTAAVAGLGDAGAVRVRVHDDADAADKVLGTRDVFISGGNEVVGGVATPVAVGSISADALNATAISTSAVNKLQTGLATATGVQSAIDGIVIPDPDLTPITESQERIEDALEHVRALAQENTIVEYSYSNDKKRLDTATYYHYDSAENATLHDKSTGLLEVNILTNTYSAGVPQRSKVIRSES